MNKTTCKKGTTVKTGDLLWVVDTGQSWVCDNGPFTVSEEMALMLDRIVEIRETVWRHLENVCSGKFEASEMHHLIRTCDEELWESVLDGV